MELINNNQLPEGYKKTEVGVIPEDWEVVLLGDCADKVGSGITPAGGSRVYKTYGRPFIRSQNIGWGLLKLDDLAYIDEKTHQSFASSEIKKNDVLLNITGASIGRSSIADDRIARGNVNQHVCIIRPIQEKLNFRFLNFVILSKNGQKQIDSFQSGSNREGLNYGQIRSFKIAKPIQIKEQKAIAQTLSDVDALIAALDKLIAKKRHIKTATMQQLLTGKTRLPGFGDGKGYKKSEVGVIPEDWELKAIKELNFDISDGNYSSKYPTSNEFKITGVPFIRANNIGQMTVIDDDMRFISVDKHSQLLKGHLRKNDILITTRGDIGQIALVPDRHINSNINAQIVRINTKDSQIYSIYFAYFLLQDTIQKIIKNMQTGSALKQLPVSRLTTLAVAIPPLPEQKAIAQVLSDIDSEITALEKRRAKTQAIKQGMMQELLTGKTRLINN
jgi:type I restriction enzyme S subunit